MQVTTQFPIDIPNLNIQLSREPKVAIIIPSKNRNDLLFNCIDSILQISQYKNYKIYVADTGSESHILQEFEQQYANHDHIELIKFNFYNYAKINNMVAKYMVDADTELLLFCNNDIQLLNDAISLMVQTYLQNEPFVGTVGARLHYDSGKIQHLGIVFTNYILDPLTHWMRNQIYPKSMQQEIITSLGNTAAFMLMSRPLFLLVGGYNEIYRQCFEDAELNLQLLAMGKKNILPTDAVCFHFESQTRAENEATNTDQYDVLQINHFIKTHYCAIDWHFQNILNQHVSESN